MSLENQDDQPLGSLVNSRFRNGQDIRDRALAFACRVVKFCQDVYERGGVGRLLVAQLVDCSTSFASMLEEAKAAESDRDFISKCCIGLKECRESWTRLRIVVTCQIGRRDEAEALVHEANALISIVTTIIQNKRQNMASNPRSNRRRRYEFRIPSS